MYEIIEIKTEYHNNEEIKVYLIETLSGKNKWYFLEQGFLHPYEDSECIDYSEEEEAN